MRREIHFREYTSNTIRSITRKIWILASRAWCLPSSDFWYGIVQSMSALDVGLPSMLLISMSTTRRLFHVRSLRGNRSAILAQVSNSESQVILPQSMKVCTKRSIDFSSVQPNGVAGASGQAWRSLISKILISLTSATYRKSYKLRSVEMRSPCR
jgi:hypothetical protein